MLIFRLSTLAIIRTIRMNLIYLYEAHKKQRLTLKSLPPKMRIREKFRRENNVENEETKNKGERNKSHRISINPCSSSTVKSDATRKRSTKTFISKHIKEFNYAITQSLNPFANWCTYICLCLRVRVCVFMHVYMCVYACMKLVWAKIISIKKSQYEDKRKYVLIFLI